MNPTQEIGAALIEFFGAFTVHTKAVNNHNSHTQISAPCFNDITVLFLLCMQLDIRHWMAKEDSIVSM